MRQYIILGTGTPFLHAQVVSRNDFYHIIQLRVNFRLISGYLYNLHTLVSMQRFHFVYYSQKHLRRILLVTEDQVFTLILLTQSFIA